jgi:hypothetical protein
MPNSHSLEPGRGRDLDEEQLQLGSSDRFWTLMRERRGQKTISRAELEARLSAAERQPEDV